MVSDGSGTGLGASWLFWDSAKSVDKPFFSSHFSQLVLRDRAGGARLAVERLEVPLVTIWLFGPLCRKCRKNPIFIIPLSSHFFHSPEHALGGRAEGVSDTRRHKRERCPRLLAESAPSSLPGALPPTRRPQRRRFYHRPPSVAPAPSRQRAKE